MKKYLLSIFSLCFAALTVAQEAEETPSPWDFSGVVGLNAFGDGVKVQNNVSIYEGVELEDNVFCGPSCVFTNVTVPRATYPVHGVYKKTLVKEGASLGANCTIVCGVTIGKNAMIAAGAVVTKDVPDNALMAGVPASLTSATFFPSSISFKIISPRSRLLCS